MPFDFQQPYLRALDAGGPVIGLKARQIGFSTTTMVQAARELCERDGWLALAISRKRETAQELVRMTRLAYQTCARPDKPAVVTDNLQEFALANGSRLVAETASEEAGRVYAASRLIFDEFAFLPWADEMWASARPTIEATGNVVIISTPNGDGDRFHALWRQHVDAAREEEDGEVGAPDTTWRCFRLPWWVHPRRDEAWKTEQLDGMTSREFAQEYECDFVAAGANVFPREAIAKALSLWPLVAARTDVARRTGGVDVAGEGRDETVATEVDASAFPYGAIVQQAWDLIPGPQLQAHMEAAHADRAVEWAIDYTGVGYGIAQNLSCPHRKVTFTGGRNVTGDQRHQAVPREMLLSNVVQMLERGEVALDPANRELLQAVRSARWEKRQGQFVDRLDSWMLALWMAATPKRRMKLL